MSNQLTTNKPKFSVAIQSDMYKNLINQIELIPVNNYIEIYERMYK